MAIACLILGNVLGERQSPIVVVETKQDDQVQNTLMTGEQSVVGKLGIPMTRQQNPSVIQRLRALQHNATESAKDLGAYATVVRFSRLAGNDSALVRFTLAGDSFAEQMFPMLDELGMRYQFRVRAITEDGCPFFITSNTLNEYARKRPFCKKLHTNQQWLFEMDNATRGVVLAARWDVQATTAKNMHVDFFRELDDTVRRLSQDLHKKVILVGMLPRFPKFKRDASAKVQKQFVVPRANKNILSTNAKIMSIALKYEGVSYYDYRSYMCKGDQCFSYDNQGNLLWNYGHISPKGGRRIAKHMIEGEGLPFVFQEMLGTTKLLS